MGEAEIDTTGSVGRDQTLWAIHRAFVRTRRSLYGVLSSPVMLQPTISVHEVVVINLARKIGTSRRRGAFQTDPSFEVHVGLGRVGHVHRSKRPSSLRAKFRASDRGGHLPSTNVPVYFLRSVLGTALLVLLALHYSVRSTFLLGAWQEALSVPSTTAPSRTVKAAKSPHQPHTATWRATCQEWQHAAGVQASFTETSPPFLDIRPSAPAS